MDEVNDIRILQHTSDLDALAEQARPLAIASDDPRIQRLVAAAAPHGIEIVVEDAPTWRAGEPARQRLGYIYNGHCFYQFGYFLGPFTDEALGDFAAYLENVDPTEENRMNIYSTELFKYLAGDMIGQREITLTITAVTMEKMNSGRGGEQNKPCLHFKERDKMMVLNKTNAAALAKALGPETDLWIGGRVTIAAPQIEAFGKTTRTLRVMDVQAAEKPAVTRAATVARQATQPPAPQPAATPVPAGPTPGPTPDDELHVMDSAVADFADVVADLLKTSAATVADRMAALGYTGVPEHGPARVQVYKALKADLGENVQAALFGTEPEPVKAGAEYRE